MGLKLRYYMKYEATQSESAFSLLCANLQTIVLGAFGNFEQTIQQLTDTLTVKDEEIKKLKEQLKAFTEPKEPANIPEEEEKADLEVD